MISTVSSPVRHRPPTIPYPGAKGRLAPTLVSMMPMRGHSYVEPFVGRGNVFFAAAASPMNFDSWHINDISTADFFRAMKDIGEHIQVPLRSREEYTRRKRQFQYGNKTAILLEPYLTFSGGGYAKGGFGGNRSANAEGYTRTLRHGKCLLDQTQAKITSLDWKLLGLESLSPLDFVFLDPPYFGADVRAYTNKFDFGGMIALLKNARFKWMLTEYKQDFYVEAFGKPYWTKEVQLACDGKGTKTRVECVWRNY
jgi:site-specific DNA-adenine methylase